MTLVQLFHSGEIHRATRRNLLRDLAAVLGEWRRRARERRELAALCDRCLRDFGVNRYDANREIRKPFWRP
jgi:uncharacterized protein YjiS (DUF1127 family)